MINEPWAVLTIIGFWGWVLCSVGFIFKVFPGNRGFNSQAAVRWGVTIVLFFSIWIFGMLKA
jgi:hypothetical protein